MKAVPRVWQRMLSGRRLDLANPLPQDIEIEDIAHGLARVARWNGQTTGAHIFSVAQHSLLVAHIAKQLEPSLMNDVHLAALLHDSPEYVVGDLISPFKALIGKPYKNVEERLIHAVHIRFGLPVILPDAAQHLIKKSDTQAAFMEATHLAGFEEEEAKKLFGKPEIAASALGELLIPQSINDIQQRFLDTFKRLRKAYVASLMKNIKTDLGIKTFNIKTRFNSKI